MTRAVLRRVAPFIAAVAVAPGVVSAWLGAAPVAAATIGPSQSASVVIPLATSIQSTGGTWATLPMGHLSQPINTFWQLFYRPSGSVLWSDRVEATATATNGGLILATTAAQPFIVGVRPTNFLNFSPLVSTTDGARSWANGLLPAGLAARPDALSIAPDGHAQALVDHGQGTEVLLTNGNLSAWTTLTTSRQLAGTRAGRSCGVTSLTAVASLDSAPVVGASCQHPGVVGIFEYSAGGWRLEPILLPSSLHHGRASVLNIGLTPYGLTAIVQTSQGGTTALLGAWTTSHGRWSVSPAMTLPSGQRLVSLGPASGIGLFVLTAATSGATHLAEVNGPGSNWSQLPPPPEHTATVAFGSGSGSSVDALAAADTTLTVWSLGSGSDGWMRTQVLPVKIEFGSSS